MAERCPICGSSLIENGYNLICPNTQCEVEFANELIDKTETEKIEVVCDKDGCNKCKIAIWENELCYYICGLGKFINIGDTIKIEIIRK